MAETPKRVRSNKKIVRQWKKQVWLKDDELTTYDSSWESVAEDTPLSTYGNSWENLSWDDKLEVYWNSEEEIWTVDDYIGGDKITARFLNYDGTVLKTEEIESGETPTAPADPTRPASAEYTYTFTGRDPVVWPITENTDYTAQYEATPIPSDSFRYIRWTLTASQDLAMSGEAQVWELTFTDWANDMVRPVWTLVTCNKETWEDWAAINLIDWQSTTKFWSDAWYPYVITFDLGSWNSINPSVYDKYTWNQAFDSVDQALRNPSAWTMEFSKDWIAWETWGSESNNMIDYPENRGLEWPFDLEKVAQYTVTIVSNDTDYWTVDESELIVNSWTSLGAVSNVLSVWSTDVTATAESGYEFVSWTVGWETLPATVTENITVTATFTAWI